MLNQIKISAPGKIILCGEHAVVYNKKALASSIDLRTYLTVNSDQSQTEFILFLNELKSDLKVNETTFQKLIHDRHNYNSNLPEIIDQVISSKNIPETKHETAIRFMLLALPSIEWQNLCHLTVQVSSEIPLGSGLGSSAAFSVCLSTLFLLISKQIAVKTDLLDFDASELEMINNHAFCLEKIFHGKPSGIDNTVSTFGDYILFEKGQIQKFNSSIDLPILIVDSGMPKNTMDQVMKVRRLYEKHKSICNQLLEAIDTIVADFVEILRTGKDLEKLEDLVNLNHGLLVALSVSNQELDAIVGVCQKNGFACKLTGGGGGGCCFVLLKNGVQYEQLIGQLVGGSRRNFKASLGTKGVSLERID